jgi:hypothetical protein
MPTRYRQLEGPAQIDTRRFESGESQAAAALSETLSGFADTGFDIAGKISAKRGAAAGATAATENKGFKGTLSSLTAYGEAYNNAALRSYAIKAEADAEDQAARLEVEAGNDPEKFRATFGAAMRGSLKEAPQEARAVLQEVYSKRLNAGTQRLVRAQTVELREKARTDIAEGIARTTERVGNLRASNDEKDFFEADEEELKLGMLIDAAEADGTLSRVEALSVRQDSQRSIVKQTVAARFKQELENPYGNPVKFIQKLKEANKQSEALPPAEEEKLVASLIADMQQSNGLEAAARAQSAAEIKARFDAGDKTATSLLLSGQLDRRTILEMVNSQDLEPSTARVLLNELQSADTAQNDDPRVAFKTRVNLLDYSEQDIATMKGLTYKTRADLIEKRRQEVNGWRGTQIAREAAARIDRALGIPEGGFLSGLLSPEQSEQRDRALSQWYDVVDALPPAERQAAVLRSAEEVISKIIRTNKASEAQKFRGKLEGLIKEFGDPARMNDEKRKRFEEKKKQLQDKIDLAEQEAARK